MGELITVNDSQITKHPSYPSIPLRDGTSYEPQPEDLDLWCSAYPNLDLSAMLWRIAAWNATNPCRRKTRRGIKRHITNWLSREDEKSRRIRAHQGHQDWWIAHAIKIAGAPE